MTTPVHNSRRVDELARQMSEIQQPDRGSEGELRRFIEMYRLLPDAERTVFFGRLLAEFEVKRDVLATQLDILQKLGDVNPATFSRRLTELRRAIESPRRRVYRKFLNVSGGLKFLLDFRADIIAARRRTETDLEPLDEEIAHQFMSWFQQGLMHVEEITVNSSYRAIQFIAKHELVHPMTNIEEMSRRLGGDRCCYALYHRAMPEEPVVFIEVALTSGIARTIHDVIGEERMPQAASGAADSAIFYSINNAQNGLAGLGLGKVLIFWVVELLRRDRPAIKNFATLSPIPGFWKRYLKPILEGEARKFTLTPSRVVEFFSERGERDLMVRCQQLTGSAPVDLPQALLRALSDPAWIDDEVYRRVLRKPLRDIVYHYLTAEHDGRGQTLNAVANFHLGNGATLSVNDVNFGANRWPHGIESSCGVMVNYIYSSSLLNKIGRTVQSLLGTT